jgi:3-deoxy-D-arabino-heptulosonate 7-phosphate (DAHP) synthase
MGMIITGPCLWTATEEEVSILETANALEKLNYVDKFNSLVEIDIFRCKLWGGGTTPEKYMAGIGVKGVHTLLSIDMPVMTEVHTPEQIEYCKNFEALWIGARNSSNYTLLEEFKHYKGDKFIKRGTGMTVDEIIGIYDICKEKHGYRPYIIERGVNHISKNNAVRWSININDLLHIKYRRSDIFHNLVIDCSHSAGLKEYVGEVYRVTKAIGCEHFMFECTIDGKSRTDQNHMLSVEELKEILK